jgi:hypothetical protein
MKPRTLPEAPLDSELFEGNAPVGRDGRGYQDHSEVGSCVRLTHQTVVFKNLPNVFSTDRVSFKFDDVLNPIDIKQKVDAATLYNNLPTLAVDNLSWEKDAWVFKQIVLQVSFPQCDTEGDLSPETTSMYHPAQFSKEGQHGAMMCLSHRQIRVANF